MTDTGRAAVLEEYGARMEVREYPIPEPAPGAILVAIEVATVCGSDLHIWEGELGATYTVPMPLIIGHEMVGRVVRLGAGAELDSAGSPLAPGDRVVWANEPCRHCYMCTVERELTLCTNRRMAGLIDCSVAPHFTGAFAEYGYISPGSGRLRVPDEVESTWASAGSCALRTVINTVEAAGRVDFLDSVVVQGAGPLGLFTVALMSLHSPRHLIVVGAPDERLELARSWGATHSVSIEEYSDALARRDAIHTITGRGGPSVAIEVSGARGAAIEGVEMLRPHGRYVISGTVGGAAQEIDVARITTRGLRLTGSMSGDVDAYFKAMEFLARHRDRFDWDRMLGKRYGLHQVNDALDAMKRMEQIKPIVDPALT
ncbi:MAG TPA: zinc-binding dehydrogenase [Solirubrobacteraceae bacterium]|jgi:threonine dehydrogenase-like Zn-dependent dehydrogenase